MSRRGHSLIELIISSALIGICLLGIWSLVQAGSRYLLVTSAKTDMQRDVIRSSRRLAHEFSETNDGSFDVNGPEPLAPGVIPGVIFASPRDPVTGEVDFDPKGRLLWFKWVAYFKRDEAGVPCIVRSASKFSAPLSFPPSALLLTTYLSTPQEGRIMARNVELFSCKKSASNLQLQMRCALPSGYGRRYGFELRTQVFAKN